MQPLLDGVISYLPSPVDVENRGLDTSSGVEEEIVVPCSADGPLVALAFKLEETRFGQLTYLRLYSGTLNRGDTVLNQTSGKKLRVPRLVRMHSDDMEEVESASAGDVVAMFGADCASMDTFTTQGTQMAMTSMFVPEPVMSLAISCPSKYSANFSKVRLLFLSCLSLLLYAWLDDDFVCRPSLNAVVIDWNLSFCLSNPRDFSATHFPPLSSQSHLQPRSPPLSLSPRSLFHSQALGKFRREDPTFQVSMDKETKETVVAGMGELHLEIYIERMLREYEVPITSGAPRVRLVSPFLSSPFSHFHRRCRPCRRCCCFACAAPLPRRGDSIRACSAKTLPSLAHEHVIEVISVEQGT